jgi:DNA repair exonuclease SbcCD ATPase subunit
MKVLGLIAENVKGLKAVEIVPDGTLQIVAGANGQGKSSVMDSIWLAIGGSAAVKGSNTSKPVRDGADGALARIDLGDIIVTRKWNAEGKSTLKVESKEGATFKSPQSMLDDLVGKLSFDPLSFSNLDDKKQLETLMNMVELPKDPAEIDREKKRIFDERTLVNREVKNLKSQLEAYSGFDFSDVPDDEVKSTDIIKEMQTAQAVINENNEKRKEFSRMGDEYRIIGNEIELHNEEIKQLEEKLNTLKKIRDEKNTRKEDIAQEGAELQEHVRNLVDPDLNEFHEKLNQVEEVNDKVRNKKKRHYLEKLYNQTVTEAEGLTFKLEDLESEKQKMIQNAKFPIEGLSFDENGVLYKGVPFKQCSSAERLRVSMSMAMSLNPGLRVIRIMDGSLLDSKSLDIIREMAADKDFQVFCEMVDESGKVGIVIEDGEVKSVNN